VIAEVSTRAAKNERERIDMVGQSLDFSRARLETGREELLAVGMA
jgi:hypothetical protein